MGNINGKSILIILGGAMVSVLIVKVYTTTLAPIINRTVGTIGGAART